MSTPYMEEDDEDILHTALEAIVARIDGEFDNPALMGVGPLSPSRSDDVRRIAVRALAKVEGDEP